MMRACRRLLAGAGVSPAPYSTQPHEYKDENGAPVCISPSTPWPEAQGFRRKLPMGMTTWVSEPRESLGPNKLRMPFKMFDRTWEPPIKPLWDMATFHMKRIGIGVVKFGDKLMGARPREKLYRLRRVVTYESIRPTIYDNCFIAPSAVVIGDVQIGRKVTVGYNAIVRGDLGKVTLGESSTVHDKTVVIGPSSIGKWSTVDPQCVIDTAEIAACSMVGAGSIVMRGAKIESNAMLCAASVLLAGAVIPSGEIWSGNPAEKLGELNPEEKDFIIRAAKHMVLINLEHADAWAMTWEELENIRIARERWAAWAEGQYERRVKAMYVRHGPKQKRQARPSSLDILGDRVNGAAGFESNIQGQW